MNTTHPAAAPYAVLRVDRRKAKAMAAISASSAHTMREKPTPNADPNAPPPVVMHLAAGKTPYQAARHLLEGAERRNRETVLCREIVLSASPSYFREGREHIGGLFDMNKMRAWANASLDWAKRQWPDQLASAVLHLDEVTPHLHILCIPRIKSATGVWQLNSKKLFDRERLRELQTGYGKALEHLGIRRGEPNSIATHTAVQQFYGAVKASNSLPVRAKLPPAPIAPELPHGIATDAADAMGSVLGFETAHQRALKAHGEAMKQWRETCRELKKQDTQAWERMRAQAAMAPINRRLNQNPSNVLSKLVPQPLPAKLAKAKPPKF